LHTDRVDFAACDELVGWGLIKDMYPESVSQFETLRKPLNQNPLRLMISRSYPDSSRIKVRFNIGLETIREKGILRQILTKYGIKK